MGEQQDELMDVYVSDDPDSDSGSGAEISTRRLTDDLISVFQVLIRK